MFAVTDENSNLLIKTRMRGFVGRDLIIEKNWESDTKRLGLYAENCGIKLYVTSTFDPYNSNFWDKMIGQAIELVMINEKGEACLDDCIRKKQDEGVKCFLQQVEKDKEIKWGENEHPRYFCSGKHEKNYHQFQKLFVDIMQWENKLNTNWKMGI